MVALIQTCSEMVIPVGIGKNSMFQPQPYSFKSLADECKKLYGVSPRPHWVTTYYGGHVSLFFFLFYVKIITFK